jgi:hypothetical protein
MADLIAVILEMEKLKIRTREIFKAQTLFTRSFGRSKVNRTSLRKPDFSDGNSLHDNQPIQG